MKLSRGFSCKCGEFSNYIVATVCNIICGWVMLNKHKLVVGDCGHPVGELVYVKCASCLSDICWTYIVIRHAVLWQGYHISTHLVS